MEKSLTTRDIIKDSMSRHTQEGNYICAQSLLGAGGVANTVSLDPKTGLIDLPISDSSNPGIVCGYALAGKNPVYIIRYAGFAWINYWTILNYAAKSKEMWGEPCKIFVRLMCSEGSIGPVASNSNHSIATHMPGVSVFAPMTPKEWKYVWEIFKNSDHPIICSEYRQSYDISNEMSNKLDNKNPKVTLIGVGAARLSCENAYIKLNKIGIKTNIVHIVDLKPLKIDNELLNSINNSALNIVVDSDYQICGISEHIAYSLNQLTNKNIIALGLEDKTAGFSVKTDNITPTSDKILSLISENLSFYQNLKINTYRKSSYFIKNLFRKN